MKNVSTLPATLEKALDNLQASHDNVKSNVEETFHVNITPRVLTNIQFYGNKFFF